MTIGNPSVWIADGTRITDRIGATIAYAAHSARHNARLISAAPELLAVLLDLRAAILDGRHDDARGIAAGDVLTDTIEKATGGAA
ncbi:MAG: hypothetical protein EBT13_16150 [Rhodobacteraceae bacterium]|nr:hypothetical protein [Paracoccaceae bacterium]